MSMKADKALSTFCFCLVAINAMFSSNRGRMSPGLDFTSCLNILTINHPSLCKTHPPSVIVQTHNPHNHLSLCKYITSTICYCANTITLTICHSANTFTINHLSLYKHIHHQLLYKHIHHKPSTVQTYSHQWLLEIISITLPETASPDALKIDMGEFNHCPLKVFSTSYFQHVDCPTRKDCILMLYKCRECWFSNQERLHSWFTSYKCSECLFLCPPPCQSDHSTLHLTPQYRPVVQRIPSMTQTVTEWVSSQVFSKACGNAQTGPCLQNQQ